MSCEHEWRVWNQTEAWCPKCQGSTDLNALLRDLSAAQERERQALHWEDVDDQWTDAIDAAHPTRGGSHENYATAMKMVGHRHSKGQLVALVCWLLSQSPVPAPSAEPRVGASPYYDADGNLVAWTRTTAGVAPPPPPEPAAPLSSEALAAIKARCDEATRGPWAWESTSNDDNEWSVGLMHPPVSGRIQADDEDTMADIHVCEGRSGDFADAAFIAAAREDVPLLLAEIERLRAAPAKTRDTCATCGQPVAVCPAEEWEAMEHHKAPAKSEASPPAEGLTGEECTFLAEHCEWVVREVIGHGYQEAEYAKLEDCAAKLRALAEKARR